MDMAGPDRRRVSLRQVTTATPAGLDFRANGVADEGCADTMSTESACSIALVLFVTQDHDYVCHTQAPKVGYVGRAEILLDALTPNVVDTVDDEASQNDITVTELAANPSISRYLRGWRSAPVAIDGLHAMTANGVPSHGTSRGRVPNIRTPHHQY